MTAVHPEAGLLDATQPDLGGMLPWEAVHKVRPPAPLTCRACRAAMTAKVSTRGMRFFAHRAAASDCPTVGETIAHRLLKIELAAAIRAAGWHAELEVPGNGWRADVLASSPDGTRRVAWEAQLASTTADDLAQRTATMAADGVEVCWVTDKDVPWVTHVPSVRVRRLADTDATEEEPEPAHDLALSVVDGHARFSPRWCSDRSACRYASDYGQRRVPCPGHGVWENPGPLPLDRFVAAVSTRTLAVRTRSGRARISGRATRHDAGPVVWTARLYAQGEDEQRDASAAYARWAAPHEKAEELRRAARLREEQEHQARIEALLARQDALLRPAVEWVFHNRGSYPRALSGPREPRWAMGVPLLVDHNLAAIICPVASRIDRRLRDQFSRTVVIVADEHEQRRLAKVCAPKQRFVVLAVHVPMPSRPAQVGITPQQAISRMFGGVLR